MRRNGFTLIELLTVVGIIALLATLLFPVYVNSKRAAQRVRCQSNLCQIARGFESYTTDHDSCYPNTGDPYLWQGRRWRWPVRKYVGFYGNYDAANSDGPSQNTGVNNNVLACPSDPTPGAVYDRTSYVYSAAFYHTPEQVNSITDKDMLRIQFASTKPSPPSAVVRTSNVRWSSRKAMVAEWLTYHSEKQVWMWATGGERNYVFADGHVTYLSSSHIHIAADGYPDINVTHDGVAGQDVD